MGNVARSSLLIGWIGVVFALPVGATGVYPSQHCRTLGGCVGASEPGSVVLVAGVLDEALTIVKPLFFEAFVPGPPSDLRATDIGQDEMTLRWQDNSLDESGFIAYYWQNESNKTERRVGADAESVRISSLSPNQYYRFKVCAVRNGERQCPRHEPAVKTTVPQSAQLLVEKVWVKPDPPVQGDGMKLLWTECNRGEPSVGHTTLVTLGGEPTYQKTHIALAEDQCRVHSHEMYVPLGSGGRTFVVEVTVDFGLDYPEANEDDNRMKIGVKVADGISGDASQGGSTTEGGWDLPF